jgi:acyl transferase domain-containing protein/acyl carrier protein
MKTIDTKRLMQDALLEIERLQSKVLAFEQRFYEPIAVLGTSCRFAGASSPDELWQNLLNGVDGVSTIPSDRWDSERYFDANPDASGRIYCRYGSFLTDIAAFDASFFGISAREATMLDPQQRILLEVVWEAIERAGLPASTLSSKKTGMFVGAMHQDYSHRFRHTDDIDLYTAVGNAPNVLAGRISHVLGLSGPTLTVDTACSSSLVAVHLACAALRADECDIAIVGGVNAVLSPLSTAAECRAHMLSPSGRCRAFDNNADGFVRGEGCGVVVLQRLSDAQSEGRQIEAIIAGSAVNHDGRSAGLTVPNQRAQSELLQAALRAARIEPDEVLFIETHGTGTPLGDPIEVAALASVFAGRDKEHSVLIGSIKSNLGHLEGAAGIAGLIKTILSVKNGKLPATLHVTEPNRGIDWKTIPLKLALQNEQLATSRRVAGVSSFGFSGTNAHAVVISAPQSVQPERKAMAGNQLLTISAKTEYSLREKAQRFAERLAKVDRAEWPDLCHSSRVARSHFSHRLAVIAASPQEMQAKLLHFVAGEPSEVLSGVSSSMPVLTTPVSTATALPEIAQRYIAGENIDWTILTPDNACIVQLPTYVFERERYWQNERIHNESGMLYRVAWQTIPRPNVLSRTGQRILIGDTAICQFLARELARMGEQCSIIAPEIDAILAAGKAERGITLVIAGAEQQDPVADIARYGALLSQLAVILSTHPAYGPIEVITQHAMVTGPAEAIDAVAAAVNAAVRVARREQGQQWLRSIDIDDSPRSLNTLVTVLTSETDEEEIVVRGNILLAPRLRRVAPGSYMPRIAEDATYVISGGTGALGLATARWLIERGARHLLLISRRGEDTPGLREQIEPLRNRGVDVQVAIADVANETELSHTLNMVDYPIRGVIHCAGIVADAALTSMKPGDFTQVLQAKVGGAYLLDKLTADQPIDLFVLFSSLSVTVGRHGQAAYAAANAWLDALAVQRQRSGRPALSIGWGAWAVGMAAKDVRIIEKMRTSGLLPLSEHEAFSSLEQAFNQDPHIIIAAIDSKRIATQTNLPRLVEGVTGVPRSAQRAEFDVAKLHGVKVETRRAMIAEHLDTELKAILNSSLSLPRNVSLLDLGMDSLTGAELRNVIERTTGASVPMDLFVDGSTLDKIIDLVLQQVTHRLITQPLFSSDTQLGDILL